MTSPGSLTGPQGWGRPLLPVHRSCVHLRAATRLRQVPVSPSVVVAGDVSRVVVAVDVGAPAFARAVPSHGEGRGQVPVARQRGCLTRSYV
jgi:hypothetical protein